MSRDMHCITPEIFVFFRVVCYNDGISILYSFGYQLTIRMILKEAL